VSIIEAALSRSRAVTATLIFLLIGGFYAYVAIPKEARPDIAIPYIYVAMTHEGISPEDAERLLVRPMEAELKTIAGVKEMRSNAYQGGANVLLEFDAGFKPEKALADVRAKVDIAKPELPNDTKEPRVNEVNLSLFPVIVATLGGEVPERTLLKLARDLREKIEGIPSVLDVKIGGDRADRVEIVIDPLLVESYGLDAQALLEFVARSNQLIAAGALDTGSGRVAIKVPGLIKTARDILDLPLKVKGDAVVTVRDVASVRRTFADRETYARLDGRPAISLEISKRAGENIIDTIEAVKAMVAEESKDWPALGAEGPASRAGVRVSYSQDESRHIRTMLADLQNNVASAILFVMVVTVATLGLRSSLLVGVSVPGSFLAGVLILYALGMTVNVVVLFSLILAVGMLVDGATVVTEYADRKMAEGLSPRDAYRTSAQRMAWPVISSTATTLAAFLPLLFWPGTVGQFMKYLPLTLIATLAASLAMALVFVPVLGARFGRPGKEGDATLAALEEGGNLARLGGATGAYVRLLERALARPGTVLVGAAGVLVGSWALYAVLGKGVEFFPKVEPDNAAIQVFARGNLSIEDKNALVGEVERQVLAVGRERGELRHVYTLAGKQERRDDTPEDLIGVINVEFDEWDRRRKADDILADVMARTRALAGVRVTTAKQEGGPPVGKPIQIVVSSRFPELIGPAVTRIREFMDTVPGLKDIEDGRPIPGIEWELAVDRAQAKKFDADVTLIGNVVKLVTNGFKVSEFRPDDVDEEVDIVVRYPPSQRTIDQLDQINLQTRAGMVPLGNFVTRIAKPASGELRRTNSRRSIAVKADVVPGVLTDDKVREIRSWLAGARLDPRLELTFKGEDKEQKDSGKFLVKAFAVALFLIAAILLTQFNSVYSTALILSAVVMSTIGVMLGLLAIGEPFGIVMSGIGVIALAGVVVSNNIILIDTYDRLKLTEPTARDAILRTGAQRLRPVVLTQVTTVVGLIPMVFAVNVDFITREVTIGAPSTQWWTQLSTAICFGLTFATVLTLVVTPCALQARENVRIWRRRRRDARSLAPAPQPAE
jgi:multidrug efflux pump